MGNYNTRAIKFRQSVNDFPLDVTLGEKSPSWGLSRWGGNGLHFRLPDDEGFTLRGDRRRLVYKGRRRSHRFTILGDSSFEYDCILNKEPDSNVISLMMDGAENFDFFRQPDFVSDPFLKGSYAVYKKETLVGEGTGKLCHIHRPEIIDARGRRCWGDLSVVGNELQILIPEKWLSEAVYPVIVDPTIGTTTVGSQYQIEYDPPDDPWTQLMFEGVIAVNRFVVPETINGLCTAYMYSFVDNYDENGGRPVLYSDNNNSPLTRKSMNEGFADFTVNKNKPAGWRTATFNSNGSIASGSYIWFGVFTDFFWEPRFDYGAKCYCQWWYDVGDTIPNNYPMYSINWFEDFKLSMYFTYTSAQNYVRTLTQGVKLTDSRKLTGDFKRTVAQTARVNFTLSRFEVFYRNCAETVRNTMTMSRLPVFIRNVTEQMKVTVVKWEPRSIFRNCYETVKANSDAKRILNIFRSIQDGLKGLDNLSFYVLIVRSVADNAAVSHKTSHWGAFIRSLPDIAGSIAETSHEADYHRYQADMVQAEGKVFRGLLLFVRIVTQVFIRDYLLGRFLKARQEMVLKSCVSREITLESRID